MNESAFPVSGPEIADLQDWSAEELGIENESNSYLSVERDEKKESAHDIRCFEKDLFWAN